MDEPDLRKLPTQDPRQDEPTEEAAAPVDESALADHLRRTSELVAAQRLDEAEKELLRAQQLDPRDLRALKLLALVRFKLGRLEEARQVYQDAVKLAPEDPAIRLNLGLIALKLESFAEAAVELEALVALRPDDRRAWSYLGYAYARGTLPAKAATAFRRAGQHELAAEMERAANPGELQGESEDFGDALASSSGEVSQESSGPFGTATPRPVPRLAATPVPLVRESADGVDLSGLTSLADFTRERFLTLGDSPLPVSSLAGGILRFAVAGDTHVRESALLVALGSPRMFPARRRTRGHLGGQKLSTENDRFLRVDGKGDLLLTSSLGSHRRLVALSLDHDVLYLKEERVVAWGDDLVWESGSLPGSGTALLQFRGTGRVVIAVGSDELVALRIAEGDRYTVPMARVAGWLGRVVVQSQLLGSEGDLKEGVHPVACEGEGVLLLSQHGEHP